MAMRGSFKKCFNAMVTQAGNGKDCQLAIIKDVGKDEYRLVYKRDADMEYRQDHDGEIRVVISPTYEELSKIMTSPQYGLFGGKQNGDI